MTDLADAGPRLRAMNDALEGLRLTDKEREAVEWAARMVDDINRGDPERAATLRRLLERLK